MATQNLVSASLPPADKTAVQTSIQAIATKLPFLISLTNDERKGGIKLGDKTVAFIAKAIGYAQSNPTLVPGYTNLIEIQKDYSLQKDLIDIQQWMAGLLQKIEDTQQEAGVEALTGVLAFYQAVRVASEKDVPGARAIYEDLKQRFPGRSKKQNPSSSTPTP
ncbi:MAG: hypothetical protein COZ21_06175 [Bacteroidetes bacterium CG_4_10_14_3_um_filter_31_20]|nr:MAG: hypothetical protein COZ21_06175 [Bacteroidetes bacterium CG_4_10_14_3_um_filter_31_20]